MLGTSSSISQQSNATTTHIHPIGLFFIIKLKLQKLNSLDTKDIRPTGLFDEESEEGWLDSDAGRVLNLVFIYVVKDTFEVEVTSVST